MAIFLLKLAVLTLIFLVVFHLPQLKKMRRWGDLKVEMLIWPFSLALAITLGGYLLRVTFYYGAIIFLIIAVVTFLALRSLTRGRGR